MKYLKLFEQDFDDPFGEESIKMPEISLDDITNHLEGINFTYGINELDGDVMILTNSEYENYYLYFQSNDKFKIFCVSFIEKYPTSIVRKDLTNPLLRLLSIDKRL